MTDPAKLRHSPGRYWARAILAGPLVVLASALSMGGGAVWLPRGAAQINNLVLPIVCFPMIWALLFFYTSLERRLARAYAVLLAITLVNAALIVWQMSQAVTS